MSISVCPQEMKQFINLSLFPYLISLSLSLSLAFSLSLPLSLTLSWNCMFIFNCRTLVLCWQADGRKSFFKILIWTFALYKSDQNIFKHFANKTVFLTFAKSCCYQDFQTIVYRNHRTIIPVYCIHNLGKCVTTVQKLIPLIGTHKAPYKYE